MKKGFRKKIWITALIIALLALVVGSASIVSAIAQNVTSRPKSMQESAPAVSDTMGEKMLYEQMYSVTHNRSRWLYDLLSASGKAKLSDSSDPQAIFAQAKSCGVIDSYTEEEMYLPLTRLFVAQTTVKALSYKQRSAGRITDITAMQGEMSTMAYYGYFLPDVNAMVHPDAQITADEYESLLTQLNRYARLKGKCVLSFGDSIMHGSGNNGEGIADMIAEKYGMTAYDYAVPGAAMGDRYGRGQIINQLQLAVADQVKPDIILLNGGTNDMNLVPLGDFTAGFDMSASSIETFTGGSEKTMWTIGNTWKNVPVIYVRAHNMNLGSDDNERLYGERALAIAKKWGAVSVDLYRDTDMNTENSYTCTRYTYVDPDAGNVPDSVHPTAIGYAKFYLPLISEAVVNQLGKE